MTEKFFRKGVGWAVISFEGHRHVLATFTPSSKIPVAQQIKRSVRATREVLERLDLEAEVVAQTVFLKEQGIQSLCQEAFTAEYGTRLPVISYVWQPPCNGAAVALETWAVCKDSVQVHRHQRRNLVSVTSNGITWVYCGGVLPRIKSPMVYERTLNAFSRMRAHVDAVQPGFDHVIRTWLYLGDIVGAEGSAKRYNELNRARSDFYRDIAFCQAHCAPHLRKRILGSWAGGRRIYPASTGIGMNGLDVSMSCLAMDTTRSDVFLLPLENPQQTPAYKYSARYSPQSPKFSRAMAVVAGTNVLIFVSGTASIVDSETQHPGNARMQTEQTIQNIERLISAENFARHGLKQAGASLSDMAAIRVYVKRPQDYRTCRKVCQERFRTVPAIYTLADICRPELLVEIEGIAFSKMRDSR